MTARTIVACMLSLVASCAAAVDYPSKPIRLIVHSPPGGGPDVMARILAERLSPVVGQPVVVENRPGASGTIALALVAKSDPDGHTLGTISPPQTVAPAIMDRMPYDTLRDLAPVRQTTRASLILVVRAGSPLDSLGRLVSAAKERPGALTYASAGNGTPQHLAAEAFKRAASIDVHHVPYKGAGAALAALLGEQVDVLFTTSVTAGPHLQSRRLRALATTGPTRMMGLADVPTLAEQGIPGFDVRDWQGLVAPSATPRAVLERISNEVGRILNDPVVNDRLRGMAVEAVPDSGPESFAALVRSELARWQAVAREGGIRAD
jgi:tripartite-type tricarboxylate transporter receptor subunit TctC